MKIERIMDVEVNVHDNIIKWKHDGNNYWANLASLHDGFADVGGGGHYGHLKVEEGEVVWKLQTGVSGPFRPFAVLGDYSQYENLRLVQGAFFIVPNPIGHIDSDSPVKDMIFNNLRSYGIPFDEGEDFVEVWAYNTRSDNWRSHGAPHRGMPQFPAYFPLSFIEDLKEREWITLRATTGHVVRLGALQSAGRYSGFGTFHETLQHLRARSQARAV